MHRWKGLDKRNTFIKKIWPNCAFFEVFYLKIPKDPKDPIEIRKIRIFGIFRRKIQRSWIFRSVQALILSYIYKRIPYEGFTYAHCLRFFGNSNHDKCSKIFLQSHRQLPVLSTKIESTNATIAINR